MTKLSTEEEAERLWNAVELAAKVLPRGEISLGVVPQAVLEALAKMAGARITGTLYLRSDGPHGCPYVIDGMETRVGAIGVRAQAESRPATPGDAALGGCSSEYRSFTPEEAAKALGVSHG